MKKVNLLNLIVLLIFISCVSLSCDPDDPVEENTYGNIYFVFNHYVDGEEVEFDDSKYTNSLGQDFGITEIQYFISRVQLHNTDGSYFEIIQDKHYHYIDSDLPATYKWRVTDSIPPGTYDSVTFIFGFVDDDNTSYMFSDDPEASMYWPNFLGGGYHYLKLNGITHRNDTLIWFNYHSGRGQYRDSDNNITGFVDCSFNVSLPISMNIGAEETYYIPINMEIQNWFQNPHDFDIQYYDLTMEDLTALLMIQDNGHDVFSAGTPYK